MDGVHARRAFKPHLVMVAVAVVGCGGSGDFTPLELSVQLDAPQQFRTALANGTLEFHLSRPLEASQRVVCAIDGEPSICANDEGRGSLRYENLGPGLHRLSVGIESGDGTELSVVEQMLEIVVPSVVVFTASPAGITASIAAARAGQTVALVEPTRWVGGMISAGLAVTDVGPRGLEIIGGLAQEFIERAREAELAKGVCPGACIDHVNFESHVAEQVFESMLAESGVVVERDTRLEDVQMHGGRLSSISTSRGELAADVFIDASYEGDLMALAGIPYRLGRESRQLANPPDDPEQLAWQEDLAGVRRYRGPRLMTVDPYLVPGDRSSGTLPFIEPRPTVMPTAGDGDSRVMAYTYRLCVTDDPSNRVPFEPPDNYDVTLYEASARVAEALAQTRDLAEALFNPEPIVRSGDPAYFKYDLNGGSTFSIDMTSPNLNQSYIEADEHERQRIRDAYRDYILGLLYTWQTNPRFGTLNEELARYGFCRDEFVDRGGWPHRLYVRVGRRMLGEYVMNQNDVLQNGRRPRIVDPVGFGAYSIDMHSYRYFAAPLDWVDGVRREAIVVEGFILEDLPDFAPYPISYRALIPRAQDATNLLNPVTLSATNVAYASLRMEPTFMILGESAGTAAALAVETQQSVHTIDYAVLRQRLLASGQRLDY